MISLKNSALFFLLPLAAFAGEATVPTSPGRVQRDAPLPSADAVKPAEAAPLPPLPEGVQELKFADFFKRPVGPRGLELSEKMAALDGQRVRVLGHMVLEKIDADEGDAHTDSATPPMVPGRLMLTATPQVVNVAHYALCEDLPPQTLFVTVTGAPEKPLPYTSGLMLLTGTLHVGAHTEADGRTSIVRLTLDPLSSENKQPKSNTPNHQPNP